MHRVRVIPILLLSRGGLVKTIRFKKPSYIGDPVNAVKIFNEKEVDELAILDIEATRTGKAPDFEKLKDIVSEAFMPMAYGGGIESLDHIKSAFGIGMEKVVVNTVAGRKPDIINKAAAIYGSQSIVVSMDVKKDIFGKYKVFLNGGKEKIKADPVNYARKMEGLGAGEIILTAIDKEGCYQGYDLELIQKISDRVSAVHLS